MKIFDAVKPECISAGQKAAGKVELLRLIAATAKKSEVLSNLDEEEIADALVKREELGSTGFGGGIAIPHCRLSSVKDFVVGLVSLPDGVDFDALDGGKVRLAVFIVAPDTKSSDHIRLLSRISQALLIPGAVEEMLKADNAESLKESFLRHVRDEVDTTEDAGKNIFHVFIQNEDLFREILQVFGAIESSDTIIVEAENTSAYLSKLPLFAGFWTDNPRTFCRVVVALVSKNMTNETIRQIDRIAGGLANSKDVLVAVQDLFYTAGQLED